MKILSDILVKAGVLVEGDVSANNLNATTSVVANTVYANSAFKNNSNNNMSLSFNGSAVVITTDAGNTINAFGNGNVSIGNSVNAGYKLDVAGTTRLNGNVTLGDGSNLITTNQFYVGATNYANSVFVGWDTSAVYLGYNMGNLFVDIATNVTNKVRFRNTGGVLVESFAGSGVRMVVADASGLLSTQAFSANVNAFQEYTYTATAGQTTFTATYTVGQVFVYYNGSKLEPSEYTATNGTSIVLSPGVNAGDIIDIIAYQTGAGIGGSGTTNYLSKWTASGTVGNSLIYDNGTSVGVNTTTLTLKFNVAGDTYSSQGFFVQNNADTFLGSLNNTSGMVVNGGTGANPSNTYIVAGGNRVVSVLATGATTFSGTVTANSLTVTPASGSSYLTLNTTVSAVNSSQIYFTKGGTSYWDLGAFNIGAAGSNDFSLYNRTTSTNAITVLAATGRVGFGTVSPLSNIHILNGSGNGAEVYASFGSTSIYSEFVHNAFGGALNLRRESDGQTNTIFRAYGNSSLNAVTGNVMIGTTTDNGYKLQVNGNVNANGLYINTGTFSSGSVAGRISSNVSGTTYCLLARLDQDAGWIARGTVVCASWTVWNVSDVYIRKAYASSSVTASITGVSKSGQDFAIVDINYSGARYLAFKFSGGNGEVDVNLTGFGLSSYLNMVTSGVTENSTLASY